MLHFKSFDYEAIKKLPRPVYDKILEELGKK
jgi:hypothetical protein